MPEVISRSSVSKTGFLGGHQFIQDTCSLKLIQNQPVVSESKDGNTRHVIRLGGQFQYADRRNQNGRVYEKAVLEHAVKEIQEDIERRSVMGELDHPPDAKIHLDNVSHLLTKLWMEGDVVLGEIEILEGKRMGQELKALVDAGVTVGISSRGVGDMETVMHEGEEVLRVLPGYTFVTFDVVAEPSVQDSYLTVRESRDRLNGGRKNHRSTLERAILKETKNILGLKK